MTLKTIILYLEKEKFEYVDYQEQVAAIQELARGKVKICDCMKEKGEVKICDSMEKEGKMEGFLHGDEAEAEKDTCLWITTSDEIAQKQLALGVAVAGFEAGSQQMRVPPVILQDVTELTFNDLLRIYQRQKKIPWKILETKRLMVREFAMEDLDDLITLYERPHMTDFVEPLYPREQEEEYEENYIENIYGLFGFGMWLVFDKKTKKLIGRAGVEVRENTQEGEVEYGILLDPDFRRDGYGRELTEAILDYTKNEIGMKQVLCRVDKDNVASQALLRKMGFVACPMDNVAVQDGKKEAGDDAENVAMVCYKKHL